MGLNFYQVIRDVGDGLLENVKSAGKDSRGIFHLDILVPERLFVTLITKIKSSQL